MYLKNENPYLYESVLNFFVKNAPVIINFSDQFPFATSTVLKYFLNSGIIFNTRYLETTEWLFSLYIGLKDIMQSICTRAA